MKCKTLSVSLFDASLFLVPIKRYLIDRKAIIPQLLISLLHCIDSISRCYIYKAFAINLHRIRYEKRLLFWRLIKISGMEQSLLVRIYSLRILENFRIHVLYFRLKNLRRQKCCPIFSKLIKSKLIKDFIFTCYNFIHYN